MWADNDKRRRIDNGYLLNAIASHLALTDYQESRAEYLLSAIHFSTYGSFYTVKDITFIVCVLVADADYRGDHVDYQQDGMIYYPAKKYPSRVDIEADYGCYDDPLRAPTTTWEERQIAEGYEPFVVLGERLGNSRKKLEKGIPKFSHILGDW
jgi:hypothetical protein